MLVGMSSIHTVKEALGQPCTEYLAPSRTGFNVLLHEAAESFLKNRRPVCVSSELGHRALT